MNQTKLKTVRMLSILTVILGVITAGVSGTTYHTVHAAFGGLTVLLAIVTTISLFVLKQ
ncbi:MAG: hypothetical protein ABSF65_07880 [Candidatus Bathyarchaeia archaeon]